MKSGAEVLVAAVRVTGETLRAPLSFPPNFPLPTGVFLGFIAVFFFFDTPDAGDLAAAFLAGAFLVPAIA